MESPATALPQLRTRQNFSFVSFGEGERTLPACSCPATLCAIFLGAGEGGFHRTEKRPSRPSRLTCFRRIRSYESACEVPADFVIVHLSAQMMATAAAELLLPSVPPLAGLQTNDPLVQNIAAMLRDIFVNRRDVPRLVAASAASLLAVRLVSWATKASANRREQLSPTALKRVYSFVEDHLAEEFRLEDMARSAGCSRFHFARAFRTRTGMTPWQFVTRSRLGRAETLLRTRRELSVARFATRWVSRTRATSRGRSERVSRYSRHLPTRALRCSRPSPIDKGCCRPPHCCSRLRPWGPRRASPSTACACRCSRRRSCASRPRAEGFEDRPSLRILKRDWPSVAATVNVSGTNSVVTTADWTLTIPTQASSLASIVDPLHSGNYALALRHASEQHVFISRADGGCAGLRGRRRAEADSRAIGLQPCSGRQRQRGVQWMGTREQRHRRLRVSPEGRSDEAAERVQ